MARRPLIGVTKTDDGDLVPFICGWLSLWLSGARPVTITARSPRDELAIDGLLLGGGADVHPALFQTAPKTDYAYDLAREATELAWLRRAQAMDLPTLGICRGAQLMNVAAGGTLHMDLAATFRETRYPSHWLEQIFFRKRVGIEQGSRLCDILGGAELRVNSIHQQGIGRLGEGLRISAGEPGGAIQAIENPARRFWVGVQFHPEFLFYRGRCRRIFRAFVEAAARFAETRRLGPVETGAGERPAPV
jgi:putative glutamine amidotransferase